MIITDEKVVMSIIQNNVDEQATEIAKSRVDKGRCMYWKMMCDLLSGKAKKDVPYDAFRKEPYKPKWCPGREPDYMYHD